MRSQIREILDGYVLDEYLDVDGLLDQIMEVVEPQVVEREFQSPEQHQAELDAWGAKP